MELNDCSSVAIWCTGKLYVYTITPTSITPVSGSPYTIGSPTGLFVR
jgi:hypothetical protein